jgi:protein CWC15
VGQTSVDEIKKRDLRAELLAAEQEARNKKRKAEGLPPLEDSPVNASLPLDEEASKRRKLLQEAIELDKDDDDDDEDGDEGKEESEKDNDR